MIALPRQLAPWAAQLTLFPEEIALSIGPMVSRLAALVGGWWNDQASYGTPDGHAGIDVRGLYDRLLISEWALLQETPDEFLRRAVSGEHLFLQRAYQDLAAAKQSIVLFDAGPDQLGAPRLVHLAILIMLAQRAETREANLQWGTFQDQDRRLFDGVTKANVRQLFHGRSDQPVVADDIRGWIACEPLHSATELWFVGGSSVAAVAKEERASALLVSEIMDAEALSRVRVTAAFSQSHVREVTLNIPPDRAAVRILRDAFDAHVAARQTASLAIAPGSNILFSPDGRKLYVRGRDGCVIAIQIPNSPRAQVGRPWSFAAPAGHTILAIGQSRSKRRVVVLSQHENELIVHLLSKRGRIANEVRHYTKEDYQMPQPAGDMPLHPLGYFDLELCFVDCSGSLVQLCDGRYSLRDVNAAKASRVDYEGFTYIRGKSSPAQVMLAVSNRSGQLQISPLQIPLEEGDGARYFFGAYNPPRVVVYRGDELARLVFRGTEQTEIEVPPTYSTIGMVERGAGQLEPFVVALDASRTRIEAFGRNSRDTLLTSATAISFAAASDAERVIAFITHAGELGVYSCRAGAMVVQLAGDRP